LPSRVTVAPSRPLVIVPAPLQRPVLGVYSSAFRGQPTEPALAPPATKTVPSASSVAVWSRRGARRLAVNVQPPVAGSYSSALACRPLRELPPTTSTRPSGRSVPVNEIRPTFMLPVGVQRFVAGSYSSAPALYQPPPATRTRPSARRTAT
jgi:hypothetical protein